MSTPHNSRFHSVDAVADEQANAEPIMAVFLGHNQPKTDIAAKVQALETLLRNAADEFPHIALASSLAAEDNVLFDAVARLELKVRVFSLNTGRLHQQTLDVAPALHTQYGKTVQWFEPKTEAVQTYERTHGADAFYTSVALRKECCAIRKVEPLARALEGADAWITGQRQAQAATRAALPVREFDATRHIEKFNPLADWSEADVWTYIGQYNVPINALHLKGFPSIGCEPCTRAITIGEDIRSGRWWWEDPASKECGLHNANLTR